MSDKIRKVDYDTDKDNVAYLLLMREEVMSKGGFVRVRGYTGNEGERGIIYFHENGAVVEAIDRDRANSYVSVFGDEENRSNCMMNIASVLACDVVFKEDKKQ